MSCHKQLRRIGKKRGAHGEIIIPWIAPDMLDEHIDILNLETVQFSIHQPEVAAVAIATDRTERSEGRQLLSHLHTADIPCVPDLVAGFEVV